MKLGIFGSSFNPPHLGHLVAAETVADRLGLDRVLFIPTGAPSHKTVALPFRRRAAMARLAIAGNPRFALSRVEARSGPSFTVRTLHRLRRSFPRVRFYFIMGRDQFTEIASWHQPRQLFDLCQVVVVPRPGARRARVPSFFRTRARFVSTPRIEVSSSALRDRIASGEVPRYLVPDAVLRYIRRNRLYRVEKTVCR